MGIILGKLAIAFSRFSGRKGTNIGGKIALKFNKHILRKLTANIDEIILVSGTNGKSTTTNIIAQTLSNSKASIVSNIDGANMYTGIVSTLIDNYKLGKNNHYQYGVFEVDEGSIPLVLNDLDKCSLVITNFFRDQLDRYAEIDIIIDKINNAVALKGDDIKLYLNVDDPFCYRLRDYNFIGYGLDKKIDIFKEGTISDSRYCAICGRALQYSKIFYGQLGHYTCECGFNRPNPKYLLSNVSNEALKINNTIFHHHIMGSYNIYNILAAISVLKEMAIKDEIIEKTLVNFKTIDGRMQLLHLNNHQIYLNLVKNHAGMNLTLQEISYLKVNHVCFLLNDYTADGKDISWIWDADFEYLLNMDIKKFFISGTRCYDMALRLKNMGIDEHKIIVNPLFETIIDLVISDNAFIIASYTALWKAKKLLEAKEH
ncbi:MAG: MurT ligase domain-containing protein [Bacilli bacterium]|jgi:UDP-N-acetylmuramyl tripeptide synthase|nr:MurT ligase domain-containing protein [Bacilli bacterium]